MITKKWNPLDAGKLSEIERLFHSAYPDNEYGELGSRISVFWIDLLKKSWNEKSEEIKKMDLAYDPSDPLSRVEQKVTVIAYADSISRKGEKSLETLDYFLKQWFPAVGGLHILPACTIVEDRFNDGYFSQVERDNIHSAFGSNSLFADIMHRYFSMNDLVLGHVDIENPVFQSYLEGHDEAGRKFYIFSMEEYESLKAAGSFDKVFRPRPFPLFSIFRRLPKEVPYRSLSHNGRTDVMIKLIRKMRGVQTERPLINILWLFNRIQNDQMLLEEEYQYIPEFIEWLKLRNVSAESIFTLSRTQEVQHTPYIFIPEIKTEEDLFIRCGFNKKQAEAAGSLFRETNARLFGEEIRALTTFSHVQVDVNTATFEGLKALAGDLVWYLTKDLNMLRLDAVNYAFKKWGTSCFGLPELDLLMKIIYLSMECISPRIIPNLEVNDSLTTILNQMSTGENAPPMMHDFHLASLLPAVFHSKKPEIIGRIFKKIAEYDIPHNSIRFSLSESHDGKSVRGSLDLLTFEERMVLTKAVTDNGGHVKYKSITARECMQEEFERFCHETGTDFRSAAKKLFKPAKGNGASLLLKNEIKSINDILNLSEEFAGTVTDAADFFFTRLLEGREPYELCITTRDSLPVMDNKELEIARFLAFETLSFAAMGRNVKTIYFNDLLALPNDHKRVKVTGELRNIKRTKTDLDELLPNLKYKNSFEAGIAKGINNLIALVDSDPALNYRGNEAELIKLSGTTDDVGDPPVVLIKNHCGEAQSLTAVNLSEDNVSVSFNCEGMTFDNFSGKNVPEEDGTVKIVLEPFGRLWLTSSLLGISEDKLVQG